MLLVIMAGVAGLTVYAYPFYPSGVSFVDNVTGNSSASLLNLSHCSILQDLVLGAVYLGDHDTVEKMMLYILVQWTYIHRLYLHK